jgi:hypothetical protein
MLSAVFLAENGSRRWAVNAEWRQSFQPDECIGPDTLPWSGEIIGGPTEPLEAGIYSYPLRRTQ